MYIQCKQWGGLPFEGGVADQPEGLLGLLSMVERVKHYESLSIKEITKLPHDEIVYIDHISGRNKLEENQNGRN